MAVKAVLIDPIGSVNIQGPFRVRGRCGRINSDSSRPPSSSQAFENPAYRVQCRGIHGDCAIAIQILRAVPHEQTSLFQIYITATDAAQVSNPMVVLSMRSCNGPLGATLVGRRPPLEECVLHPR